MPHMPRVGRRVGSARSSRALTTLTLAVLSIAATAAAYALMNGQTRAAVTGHARIIDGDSLVVGGVEVRIFGVDAPEFNQRCGRDGRDVACGREAARHLATLIAGQQVSCERRDVDRFQRVVAVCRADGMDLGQAMVAAGQAVAFGAYQREEAGARLERKGVWAGEFLRPREWRDRERQRFGPEN